MIIAGPVFGRFAERLEASGSALFASTTRHEVLPGALASYLIAPGAWRDALQFVGHSTVALLLSVIVALLWFGVRRGVDMDTQTRWIGRAISGIAVILLVITAGGVFKQVRVDTGTGDYISSCSRSRNLPPLIFAWLVAALLRVMIGSATVAGITAAGVVSPLLATTGVSPELLVLAVGAGSVFCSHVNDSAFWNYKEFFGLTMKQTFLTWTTMETLISVVGMAGVRVLDAIVS